MPTYSSTISVNFTPDKLYKATAPANVSVFYSGKQVWGGGANNYFFANDVNQVIVESASPLTGDVSFTEILTNYYEAYDGNGGTWCYHPQIDHFTGKYSFRPEWMSMVGNRLATFKNGALYLHDGVYNTFYGKVFDSAIAAVHNEAGNTTKVYQSVAVEGSLPDRMHFRTEVPNVQSSDLVASDFSIREGVNYANILRDRLSPNKAGTYEQKLYKGDPVRGEVCKYLGLFSAPTTKKTLNFVDIKFNGSKGQTV